MSKTEFLRKAVFSGEFYPKSSEELKNKIKNLLEKPVPILEGEIFGLILPHAAYEFSGEVAAAGFKQLEGKKIETVVLIGNSHYQEFNGISIFPRGFFETPLGKVEIDASLAEELMKKSSRFFFHKTSHKMDHVLEVQIPFLQVILKKFKILPILFGNKGREDYKILANALFEIWQKRKFFLISTSDLSHYSPLNEAEIADRMVIEAILTGKVKEFENKILEIEKRKISRALVFTCSPDAIKTLLCFSENLKEKEIKLLRYSAKGESEKRVVGYAAIGFFKKIF